MALTLLSAPLDGLARLRYLRDKILWMFNECPGPVLVVIEGYAFGMGRGNTLAFLGELGGVVKIALADHTEATVRIVPPATLKKFVAGKGNAPKAVMLKEVFRRFGVDVDDDNLADAAGLCFIGRALAGDWTPTTDFQRAVIAEIQSGKAKKVKKGAKSKAADAVPTATVALGPGPNAATREEAW